MQGREEGALSIGGRRARPALAILLTLAVSFAAAACGGGSNNREVTLTVGSRRSTEETVLGQIYARALEAAGYTVKRDLNLGSDTSRAPEALKRGEISGYPGHVRTALTNLFGVKLEDVPADAQQAYEEAKAHFEEEGLTAFPPTPFTLANAVGMLKTTAEERGLKTVSDLRGQSDQMTLNGPPGCHLQLDCLIGLESRYGIVFKWYSSTSSNLRYKVLEEGRVDSSMLLTTDGQLATGKFVILEDDKHVFPANNVIWVTTPKIVEEAGPGYEKAIVDAQKGLTLKVMQELDARVDLEKKPAARVAAEYLESAE